VDAVLEPNNNYSNAALTQIHSRVKRAGVQQKLFQVMVLTKKCLIALIPRGGVHHLESCCSCLRDQPRSQGSCFYGRTYWTGIKRIHRLELIIFNVWWNQCRKCPAITTGLLEHDLSNGRPVAMLIDIGGAGRHRVCFRFATDSGNSSRSQGRWL
jgi:hypothetical protein